MRQPTPEPTWHEFSVQCSVCQNKAQTTNVYFVSTPEGMQARLTGKCITEGCIHEGKSGDWTVHFSEILHVCRTLDMQQALRENTTEVGDDEMFLDPDDLKREPDA